MERVKVKVIGVLRERGGTCAINLHDRHQAGNNLNIINNNHSSINNNNIISNRQDNGTVDAVENVGVGAAGGGGAGDMNGGAGGGGGGGGAARTTTIMVRQQAPKMNTIDLAGILNIRRRFEWTKEWLKKNQSEFLSKENLLSELNYRNNETYHLNCFLAITEQQFRYLVNKLEPEISNYEPHRKKKSFSAEERIAITLKYLATGEVHSCRNYCFRASKPVILKMIANICMSFYTVLKDQFLQIPKTDAHWAVVIDEFQQKYRLPYCLGNLFMRQIQFHSSMRIDEQKEAPLVLTGIVDSNNSFIYVNVETTKSKAPNEIFEKATIKEIIENRTLPLPLMTTATTTINAATVTRNTTEQQSDTPTDGDSIQHPNPTGSYYFIGNSTLPTKPYMVTTNNLKPTVVNNNGAMKSLEQINQHTEQTLRILCNIFPILAQPMRIEPMHARKIALGCVALYNYLRKSEPTYQQRTEQIVSTPMEGVVAAGGGDDDDSDEDCIMIVSDEELRERAEFTPAVGNTTCLQQLNAQIGETLAGVRVRDYLMQSN